MLKRIAFGAMMALLLLGILITSMPIGAGQETRVVEVVNAQNGSNSTSLGSASLPVPLGGYPFMVNVSLLGAAYNLFTYQVAVKFDRTLVRCTAAWINVDDPNFVFYDNRNVVLVPQAAIDNDTGVVVLGASLIEGFSQNTQGGLLCQINFTAIATGDSAIEIIPTNYPPDDTFLWDTNQSTMSFSSENFQVTTVAAPTDPVASFDFTPVNPAVNQTVTFDASESYDPNGGTLQYFWDFGDGFNQTDEESKTYHNYTLNGPYLVNLTVVKNQTSLSNTLIREIQVGGIPRANFTYAPVILSPFEPATFNVSGSFDPDGQIVSYRWDFGDGNVTTVYNPIVTITHSFSTKGAFRVNLTVVDNDNLHDSFAQDVLVGQLPIVSFTFSPTSPKALEVVTFDASQSHAAESSDYITSYVWDFDDLNITTVNSTASNPQVAKHLFPIPGDYNVNLTVYDNNGLYNSNIRTVTIQQTRKNPDYTLYIIAGAVIVALMVAVIVYEKKRPPPKKRSAKKAPSKTQSSS